MQTCVKRIRLDMPVTDSDFVSQTADDIDEPATVISYSYYCLLFPVLIASVCGSSYLPACHLQLSHEECCLEALILLQKIFRIQLQCKTT